MCGIFGYIGNKQEGNEIVIEGLKKLEYRGYDSWGVAFKTPNKIFVIKKVGKIHPPKDLPKTNLTIGHTRWATHGKVNEKNAHPHFKKNIAIVHNGIIENHNKLQTKYKINKISETDSEIIAHIISKKFQELNDLEKAVKKTIKELKGSFALAVIHKNQNKLIVARRGSPIIIGIKKDEKFIASDVSAILKHTNKVIYLEDEEIAILKEKEIKLFSLKNNRQIRPQIKTINWTSEKTEKKGFKHFMLKEIFEQPEAIRETLEGRIKNGKIILPEIKKLNLKKVKRIIILACGTSWHAGLIGKFAMEGLAKIPIDVEYASEFRYREPLIEKNTLCIAISQSGETADTLSALKEAKKRGAKTLTICNVNNSTMTRESEYTIYTRAGPEIGVASTKAFTTQLIILYLLTTRFIEIKKTLRKEKIQELIRDIKQIPNLISQILEKNNEIKKLAKKLFKANNALFLGRGIQFPIALEGALKLKEVSYIHAEGYPAAEIKHGPIALIDKQIPVIFLATKDNFTYEKILGNIQEVKAREGNIIIISTEGSQRVKKLSKNIIEVPNIRYSLSSLLTIIPLQLLAYHIAVFRKCDVDKPRNLAKSVTVE